MADGRKIFRQIKRLIRNALPKRNEFFFFLKRSSSSFACERLERQIKALKKKKKSVNGKIKKKKNKLLTCGKILQLLKFSRRKLIPLNRHFFYLQLVSLLAIEIVFLLIFLPWERKAKNSAENVYSRPERKERIQVKAKTFDPFISFIRIFYPEKDKKKKFIFFFVNFKFYFASRIGLKTRHKRNKADLNI